MIRLTRSIPLMGGPPALMVELPGWALAITGAGGPYGPGKPVDIGVLTPHQRHLIQHLMAREMAAGMVDRAEGEAFLDILYSDPTRIVDANVAPPGRTHARKGMTVEAEA